MGHIAIHPVNHCNYNCKGCNHFSPYLEKKENEPEQFVYWLNFMKQKGFIDDETNVILSGGEPFLHSNLYNFVTEIKKIHPKISLFTNGYWLKSKQSIEDNLGILEQVNYMLVSKYPGKWKRYQNALLKEIKKIVPHLDSPTRKQFCEYYFTEQKINPNKQCSLQDCTNLLPDGKLLRCPIGWAIYGGRANEGFSNSQDLAFDLNEGKDFWQWLNKFPLDACYYCCHSTPKKHSFLK